MPLLQPEEHVFFKRDESAKMWEKGHIQSRDNDGRKYTVEGEEGGIYQRNRRHIRRYPATRPVVDTPATIPEVPPESTTMQDPPPDPPIQAQNEHVQVPCQPKRDRKPPAWMRDYMCT